MPVTLGYGNGDGESPAAVACTWCRTIEAVDRLGVDARISLKIPAFGSHEAEAHAVFERARDARLTLVFDALAYEAAPAVYRMALHASRVHPGNVTLALPGRWRRSLLDARRACDVGQGVRVIKGQWSDPTHRIDPSEGMWGLVRELAGRARHVSIATHDVELAEQSLEVLLAAGTPCELELLYGLPLRGPLALARRLGVAARIYLPFGRTSLPYQLRDAARRPRFLWRLARDCAGRRPLPHSA